MRGWSLKVKVGAYAALLTVVSLAVAAAVLLPWFHYLLLDDLDASLRESAQELARDLRHFKGAPVNPRLPLSADVIPVALQEKFLEIHGPEGQILYRSPGLDEVTILRESPGLDYAEILGRECRIGVFVDGPYTVKIGTDLAPMRQTELRLRRGFYMALPLVGGVVFLGGIWLGRTAVSPVTALIKAAERIGTRNPEERLPMPPTGDEIARLTEVLNESFDRLQKAYDSARRFSADASHQLKTPVSVLRIGLDELRRNPALSDGEKDEVRALIQQTRRLSTLIEDLLLLAQVDSGRLEMQCEAINLIPLVDAALDDLGALVEEKGIRVESELAGVLSARGDRPRVALVLQNLVENAAKYTPPGGRVRLTAERESTWARIRVGNSGEVVPQEDQARIFERFHRGSRVGENVRGQGLGLNIARELARAQGGDLRLEESRDGWTQFLLELPVEPDGSAAN